MTTKKEPVTKAEREAVRQRAIAAGKKPTTASINKTVAANRAARAAAVTAGGAMRLTGDGFLATPHGRLFSSGLANLIGVQGVEDAAVGGFSFGSGGSPVNLFRTADGRLRTDGSLVVGAGIRTMGPLTANSAFTINNGGTATFANRLLEWQRIEDWVFFSMRFDVTAVGSGTVNVTVTGLGLPQPANQVNIPGDRAGVGILPISARLNPVTGVAEIALIHAYGTAGTSIIQGQHLANGAVYRFVGMYQTNTAWP